MSIVSVKVEIEGTKPFLYHKFNIEEISSLSKIKEGSAGNNPSEWRKTFHSVGKKLFIPSVYFFSCLRDGSKYTKVGRGTIQKTLMAALNIESDKSFIENRELPIEPQYLVNESLPFDSSFDLYVDVRGVMNPNSKGRNVRYRLTMNTGWKTSFVFNYDNELVSKDQMKKIVQDSGKMIGVGDALALGYGRFAVNSYEILKS
jgi:hypothetical protein